ncbi:aminotransferase class V-fold PLP-dependent enzyme [Kordiimonas sp. SCSIO 12610]|uniref:aminotransferase class V-fold PLP-dependent enzyme n=1 Tax=Kordiimonas sp. SCSIO 12610 TaxID=2829597 RepID=UPI00210A5B39|nr:aminotransferase class V-fold PLP-dependent enzyme [Kordiimonas sp. SCSIO 12610]UTW56087.1 aminotransferase class V-fold PLP-dependent enzyme [Kordiimonas sp. SCSIO 12610]
MGKRQSENRPEDGHMGSLQTASNTGRSSAKPLSRRGFLTRTVVGTIGGIGSVGVLGAGDFGGQTAQAANLSLDTANNIKPDDEAFWREVAGMYDVTDQITNLENGYWGIMARPVLEEYQRQSAWVNKNNTFFARFDLGETYRNLRAKAAEFLNVGVDEIALTRGATEALQALIGGYNRLNAGDTVLYADLDYSEMKNAMRWLAHRRGVNVVKVNFPEPTKERPLSEDDIIRFYKKALDDNPKTKLLLLTHLNNWTGLIIPVRTIADMAKARGVGVILDAAHSVGQVDFDIKSLGCDFVGVNLHKWVGAPIGCGVIYINKSKVRDIDPYMGKNMNPDGTGGDNVRDRIDTGTSNFAAHMTIPAAIDFHGYLGSSAKEARLRYLRSIWVSEARKMKDLLVLTPDDPAMVAGLTSFRLKGVTTTKANNALMKRLADEFGVLTTRRTGPAMGDCIRVTPSFYNTPDDMHKLVKALRAITA